MKSLDEFNAEKRKLYEEHDTYFSRPRRNGIACPKCGKELWDSQPNMTLSSNPPQKNVACLACDYVGFRVA